MIKTLEKEELFYIVRKDLLENYVAFKTTDENIILKVS